MSSVICTLFEGDYHHGVAVLAASLHARGYRGPIYAGFRGSMPPWAPDARHRVTETLWIEFIRVEAPAHLANFKPDFMLRVLTDYAPSASAVAYFDPDIVVRSPWSFFDDWMKDAVALCADVNWQMPASHPVRKAWLDWAGISAPQGPALDLYMNSGFAGVPRKLAAFLETWSAMVRRLIETKVDVSQLHSSDYRFPGPDQDTMNIAAMVHSGHLSLLGAEGMDFVPGSAVMSHAIGTPKPWRKDYIRSALGGVAPTRADKAFWPYANAHFRHFAPPVVQRRKWELAVAAAIGRVVTRR